MKIKQRLHSVELQKRFFHGYIFHDDCPSCGYEQMKGAGGDSYIFCSVTNAPLDLSFCCDLCSYEWEQKIIIKMEIVAAEEKVEVG